jgi:hypothetical protein
MTPQDLGDGLAGTQVFLFGPGREPLLFSSASPSQRVTFAKSGLFRPGDYDLIVLAKTFALADGFGLQETASSFAFDLNLTSTQSPVPEPSTLTLLGTVIAGMAVSSWSRRRKTV